MDVNEIWELVVKESPAAHTRVDHQAGLCGMDPLPPVWTDDLRIDVPEAAGSTRPHLVVTLSGDESGGDAFMRVAPTLRQAQAIAAQDAGSSAWICNLASGEWYPVLVVPPAKS